MAHKIEVSESVKRVGARARRDGGHVEKVGDREGHRCWNCGRDVSGEHVAVVPHPTIGGSHSLGHCCANDPVKY